MPRVNNTGNITAGRISILINEDCVYEVDVIVKVEDKELKDAVKKSELKDAVKKSIGSTQISASVEYTSLRQGDKGIHTGPCTEKGG